MTPLVIENDILRLTCLPELGGKVTSFFVKPAGRDLLFQPRTPYRLPRVGDSFASYDTSGWDEMLPTIDPCPWEGKTLPDHGEIWARNWEVTPDTLSLTGRVRCEMLPLLFERAITLDGFRCHVAYQITNLSDVSQPYLWAWHALWDIEDLEIHLPLEKVVVVHDHTFAGEKDEVVDWPLVRGHDLRRPWLWEGEKTTKLYALPSTHVSWARLTWPDVSLSIQWDDKKLPYLGIWYNHGGFKHEYNIAIEPATGYYDRLDEAFDRGMVSLLSPHETHTWYLDILVSV